VDECEPLLSTMSESQAGTGSTEPFNGGDIGAAMVPTADDGQRPGFTPQAAATPIGIPNYQRNKTGLAGNGGYDCLPGEEGK
jgi:hypothetical protein